MNRDEPTADAIESSLAPLRGQLAALTPDLERPGAWCGRQLDLCAQSGVFRWFVPREYGGDDWPEARLVRGYLELSRACLTTAFVITQRSGACRRIAVSDNGRLKDEFLPGLASGELLATVGISHLTTSRRHLGHPALRATPTADGYCLDGFSPWVTGAPHAAVVVTGATLDDGREILVALRTELPGVSIPECPELVALSASHTGPVHCQQVHVPREDLLAGPVHEVMKQGAGAGTGGLQTSTLAIGLAAAAIDWLEAESERRADLVEPAAGLRTQWREVRDSLLRMADGQTICSHESLRLGANRIALSATQAALAAAKGSGYVVGHPAGRWCREALFFLVWSCPQPVVTSHLCELAGLGVIS